MNTKNGSLNVRIAGDTVHMVTRDCDVATVAAAEMDVEQVKTLRAILEEALSEIERGPEYVTCARLNQ